MEQSRVRAPELPDSLQWLNTSEPLKLADQRGKVVLLDFWTYSCINCMHILPDLAHLAKKYPDGLTVIGIHSPKYANERVAENVQKAINRYHIRHPVAHDPQFTLWKQFGIRAWPSIIFIDPEGYVRGVLRGEGRRRQLDKMIGEALAAAEKIGVRAQNRISVVENLEPQRFLRFPGKVLAGNSRVFISDSGHNRIVETMPGGRVMNVYGSGAPGLLDGPGPEAAFCEPQGLALVDNSLFVADTGNHAVRRIDLRTKEVWTVAGTGEQGRYPGDRFDDPHRAVLNSPWDLVYSAGTLYIAMAGPHQLWRMNLTDNHLVLYAGSGREGIEDGANRQATFAQPCGLAIGSYLESTLYVADSETSAIRSVRVRGAHVSTLVGMGLFEFGDLDATGRNARLQHPMGVAFDEGRNALWVADTYNHKIKKLDLATLAVTTLPVQHPLCEPAGISFAGESLWVANTNAHEIVRVDVNTGSGEVVELFELEA